MTAETREFECFECGRKWQEPFGTGRPTACPSCGGRNIRRSAEDRGRRGLGQGRRAAQCAPGRK